MDCSNCEAVYFCESKQSLKLHLDEHKRYIRNCGCDENEKLFCDQNFSCDQKNVVDKESRLTPRKIK